MKKVFLLNAFSLQMLEGDSTVKFTEVSRETVFSTGHWEERPFNDEGGIPTDNGTEMFWESDYVAQLQGGRLPEGSTTLPEGFSFKFIKVEVI